MSKGSKSVEEILDAVSYRAEDLPHPVDLLSADLMAEISGVPKTTLLSAASSMDHVRSDVLACAISQLEVVPGKATWDAMRSSLVDTRARDGLAAIMHARAHELASDPAFPHFLSGFDRLESPIVASSVSSACGLLVSELVPFADTVLHTAGEERSLSTPRARMSLLSHLMAMALQRLMTGGSDSPISDAVFRSVAANAGFGILADARAEATAVEHFVPVAAPRTLPEGNQRLVVDAAADLLLSGNVPLRFGMKLDDVLKATGLSSATFYRRFGSLVGFERMLVERTGRELVRAFRDDFFEDLLASVADGSMTPSGAIGELQRWSTEIMERHVETARPGTQVLPWMATEIGVTVFAPALMELSAERGEFFSVLLQGFGLPIPEGIDATAIASTLHAYAWTAEMLTRNAPDRQRAAAFMHAGSATVQRALFGLT